MKYTLDKIRAYRRQVNTIEKILSIPAKTAIVAGGIMAIFPLLQLIGNGGNSNGDGFSYVGLKVLSYSIPGYFIVTVMLWLLLFLWKKAKMSMSITRSLLLGIFIADLYFLSLWLYVGRQPLESNLFWLYCLIIIRNVIYFPEIVTQIILTISIMFSYGGAYIIRSAIIKGGLRGLLSVEEINALGLRIIILILVNLSGWGLYVIFQRRQEEEEELQERTIRSERLNLAGLVAREAAHSLKNPLAIINNACFLLGKVVDNNRHDVKENLGIIRGQVDRADGIVNELTRYSELASGKIENADVNEKIDECIKDLEYEINERGISVEVIHERSLPGLMIEESQLKQVISNLLLNACQAIKKDGKIWIRSIMQLDGKIRIEIEDNGEGIKEENLDRIFKAHYTTKEMGSGIGLSIVHAVVVAYGGRIDVESELGKGTKFALIFPTRTERVE